MNPRRSAIITLLLVAVVPALVRTGAVAFVNVHVPSLALLRHPTIRVKVPAGNSPGPSFRMIWTPTLESGVSSFCPAGKPFSLRIVSFQVRVTRPVPRVAARPEGPVMPTAAVRVMSVFEGAEEPAELAANTWT